LLLGQGLNNDESLNGEGFNFGPTAEQNHTVKELIEDLSTYWGYKNVDDSFTVKDNIPFHEAELLKLNCDKALFYFKWQGNMGYKDTIKFTGEWYYNFYNNDKNILDKTISQINEYEYMAKEKGLLWTE
jgi:CDP-glucose 4,6-dehydratase